MTERRCGAARNTCLLPRMLPYRCYLNAVLPLRSSVNAAASPACGGAARVLYGMPLRCETPQPRLRQTLPATFSTYYYLTFPPAKTTALHCAVPRLT